jgi:YidC/Oxa1 family membrane protein insertase
MEKRLLYAFALSFLIIMGWRYFLEKTAPPLPPKPASVMVEKESAAKKAESPGIPAPVVPLSAPIASAEKKQAEAEQFFEIETDLYQIKVSNRGGVIHSWILKNYSDSNRKPLELINSRSALTIGFPLELKIPGNEAATTQINKALFQIAGPEKIKLKANEKASLALEYSDGAVLVKKNLNFGAGSYLVGVDCQVGVNGQPSNYVLLWKSGFGDFTANPKTALREMIFRAEGSVTRMRTDKIQKKINSQVEQAQKEQKTPLSELEFNGRMDYAGLDDQYFAAVFLPGAEDPLGIFSVSVDSSKKEDGNEEYFLKAGVGGNSQERSSFRLFVGPKDTEVLKKTGFGLEELLNYGWFKFFCKPMFITLKWLYSFSRNYGVAIILLTLLISVALLPLRIKSIHSAQKMQKLQPQLKVIQEKYKKLKPTDPKKQQMNVEVMDLYKKHGVNPLGGCLPLVIQLPFFYAIYNLLSVAIELRQAPFAFWIKDLSLPDSIYVLPILFTASMVLMQKMTPTPSSDPVQAKMMMAMPLVFGVMLSATPSGLVLYWLTSNVVGIVQQLLMNKYGPGAREKLESQRKKK